MVAVYFIKLSFLAMLIFTLFNSVGILKVPLGFPWIFLAFPIFLGWWFWEKFSRKKLAFPNLTGSLLVLLVYSEGLGNAFNLYNKFGWYDRLTHLLGGITVGLIFFLALFYWDKKYKWKMSFNFLIIFALSLTLTVHVGWEFYEYFADALSVKSESLIPDKYDTVDDLLFGFVGSVMSILFSVFFLQPAQPSKSQKPT